MVCYTICRGRGTARAGAAKKSAATTSVGSQGQSERHIIAFAGHCGKRRLAAGATKVEVAVEEDLLHDRLRISVRDDGKGMTGHWVPRMGDPFVTSQATRKVGMGIPLLQAAAEACNGSLIIASEPVQGTTLHVEFQHSHVDRMPLGDLGGTWFALTIGFPQTHWIFRYRLNGAEFIFDDEPIKRALHGIPLTEPDVLTFIRVSLERGIANVQSRQ